MKLTQVWDWLIREPYDCSYALVRRYTARWREETKTALALAGWRSCR